jgi:hypothetical protein
MRAGWTIQPTPNPADATASEFHGVSCTSARSCTVVGVSTTSSSTLTLAERWNGRRWSIQPTPNPSSEANGLSGVSCTSTSFCTAVGNYYNSSRTDVTLAERWDGTSWVIDPTPNPSGAIQSVLEGVSCTSPSSCMAVGWYIGNTGEGYGHVPLAERWDGTSWVIEPNPNTGGAFGGALFGVSCLSPHACSAVGSTGGLVTLAERWDGTKWAVQPTPNPAGTTTSQLDGVSCTSASSCTAVGSWVPAHTGLTLAERWNGTKWKIQPTPNPARSTQGDDLHGVSCTSPRACTAVGWYFYGTQAWTLAEAWKGTSWKIQRTGVGRLLFGVSCPWARVCTAVGDGAILAERHS